MMVTLNPRLHHSTICLCNKVVLVILKSVPKKKKVVAKSLWPWIRWSYSINHNPGLDCVPLEQFLKVQLKHHLRDVTRRASDILQKVICAWNQNTLCCADSPVGVCVGPGTQAEHKSDATTSPKDSLGGFVLIVLTVLDFRVRLKKIRCFGS